MKTPIFKVITGNQVQSDAFVRFCVIGLMITSLIYGRIGSYKRISLTFILVNKEIKISAMLPDRSFPAQQIIRPK